MRKHITITTLAAAGIIAGLSACGGSGPTASSVLSSDGYTHSITAAQLSARGATLPTGDTKYISSYAAGTNGARVEVVFILTPAGVTEASKSGGSAALARTLGTGWSSSIKGTVIRADSPLIGG